MVCARLVACSLQTVLLRFWGGVAIERDGSAMAMVRCYHNLRRFAKTSKQTNTETINQARSQTDTQAHKQTNTQTNEQTNKRTHTETNKQT